MKIVAFYLPQFHCIPENDEWWGKGFTEWVNVKKAKPLFEDHNQPRVPLDENYYNLLNNETIRWQAELAKEYGIYGFCIYHYWFGGHKLLQKPMENFLQDKTIDINYCVCWANENWTNAWASAEMTTLISQKYGGEEEWTEHFMYLLPFFQDERYIKEDNKPLIVIYRPDIIECRVKMFECWERLAKENGFAGIKVASQNSGESYYGKEESFIDYRIEYQPNHASRWLKGNVYLFLKRQKEKMMKLLGAIFKTSYFSTLYFKPKMEYRDYDKFWKIILKHKPLDEKSIAGAFVDWDCTPRKGERGSVCIGVTIEKFKFYFGELIKKVKSEYKTDYIFIFAWNEWAEGGYLEPDTKNQYGFLEAIKEQLMEAGEI